MTAKAKSLVVALLLMAFLAGGFLGWSIRARMIYAQQGYAKIGGAWKFSHPTPETYARVNGEANAYLRELIGKSALGWDLSDWRLGCMCSIIPGPGDNGYSVIFWCGNTQRQVPDDIIEKLKLFLLERLEKGRWEPPHEHLKPGTVNREPALLVFSRGLH